MTSDGRASRGGLLTFGESMGLISALDIGPIEFVRGFQYGIGGAESNVAIGAARLGAPATWAGRLGRDATGDMIERRLHAEGVRVHAIRDDGFTGIMVRYQRLAGHVSVDYHRTGSASSRLCRADIPDDLLAKAGILHVTGITAALSESARDAVFDAVARARCMGASISVDVNYRAKLWQPDAARPVLTELAAKADIVMAGADEARLLVGQQITGKRAMAKAIAGLGPAEVIVKDGNRGCTALIDGAWYELPAISVQVVDQIGAGDAFAAGYLADRLAGQPPPARLRTAIAAGAFAVAVPGDCEGLPRRQEIDELNAHREDADR
jgi:2-dehydro-3-deoxygluconokinase